MSLDHKMTAVERWFHRHIRGTARTAVMESDHEAMEALRRASLSRGWAWRWDGMDLIQVPKEPSLETFDDPADALRSKEKKSVPEDPTSP